MIDARYQAAADKVQAGLAADYARVDGDVRTAPAAKQQEMARLYLGARADMDSLQDQLRVETATKVSDATARAFGLGDIPTSEHVSAALSLRDAQDRAAQVSDPGEARALLDRALATGDRMQAKALAHQAFTKASSPISDPAWGEVIDAFTAAVPSAAAPTQMLVDHVLDSRGSSALADAGTWFVPRPPGMEYVDDWKMRAAADADLPATA